MGDRWRCCEDYINCIEADILPSDIGVAGEFPGSADQTRALLEANGAVGSAIVIGLPRFHLDEDQPIILPTDEIDFASAGGHAIVAGDNDEPVTLQVTVGDVLAATTKGMVGSKVMLPGTLPEHIGEFIEPAHHK
jgi:hypothetical protein